MALDQKQIKSIKHFIIWAKKQRITRIKIADVEVQFSERAWDKPLEDQKSFTESPATEAGMVDYERRLASGLGLSEL